MTPFFPPNGQKDLMKEMKEEIVLLIDLLMFFQLEIIKLVGIKKLNF